MNNYHKQGFDKQNLTRMPHRLYRQVTYDNNFRHIYLQATIH